MSIEHVPTWPRIHAVVRTTGEADVDINGTPRPIPAGPLEQTRAAIIGFGAEVAQTMRRAVRVTTSGADGSWLLVVEPDGSVSHAEQQAPAGLIDQVPRATSTGDDSGDAGSGADAGGAEGTPAELVTAPSWIDDASAADADADAEGASVAASGGAANGDRAAEPHTHEVADGVARHETPGDSADAAGAVGASTYATNGGGETPGTSWERASGERDDAAGAAPGHAGKRDDTVGTSERQADAHTAHDAAGAAPGGHASTPHEGMIEQRPDQHIREHAETKKPGLFGFGRAASAPSFGQAGHAPSFGQGGGSSTAARSDASAPAPTDAATHPGSAPTDAATQHPLAATTAPSPSWTPASAPAGSPPAGAAATGTPATGAAATGPATDANAPSWRVEQPAGSQAFPSPQQPDATGHDASAAATGQTPHAQQHVHPAAPRAQHGQGHVQPQQRTMGEHQSQTHQQHLREHQGQTQQHHLHDHQDQPQQPTMHDRQAPPLPGTTQEHQDQPQQPTMHEHRAQPQHPIHEHQSQAQHGAMPGQTGWPADPAGALGQTGNPGSQPDGRQSFLTVEQREQPATRGVRGAMSRLGVRMAPSEFERAIRADEAAVSKHWPGPRTIAIVNGKGGAGKTPTTVLLAAMFARHGGAGVLAWDNNQTRGTLGWRTEQAGHQSTLLELLPETERLLGPDAKAADLAQFVHHQAHDKFDVLRSKPMRLAHENRVSPEDVDDIHRVASKFYRLIVIDSGNDESDPMWLRMIDHADQIVVATTTRDDHAEAGALLLEALAQRDERSAALARASVVVVSQADPKASKADVDHVFGGYGPLAREVVRIPFDPAIVDGHLRLGALRTETQRAWLGAAAAVARGL